MSTNGRDNNPESNGAHHVKVGLEVPMLLNPGLEVEARDGSRFLVAKEVHKEKKARRTGAKAKDLLRIDHLAGSKMKKTHRVFEQNVGGQFVEVHHDDEILSDRSRVHEK